MAAFMRLISASVRVFAEHIHELYLLASRLPVRVLCVVRACVSDARVPPLDVMRLVQLARSSAVLFAELEMVRWSAIVLFALAAAIGAQFYGYG